MRRILSALLVIMVLSPVLVLLGSSGTALARDQRTAGKYELAVGFPKEPALPSQPNGISLVVTNTEAKKPVEGLWETLETEITSGAKAMRVALPTGREPAHALLVSDFVPPVLVVVLLLLAATGVALWWRGALIAALERSLSGADAGEDRIARPSDKAPSEGKGEMRAGPLLPEARGRCQSDQKE